MSALEERRAEFLRLMKRRTTECVRCESAGSSAVGEVCPDCNGYGLVFICGECGVAIPESGPPLCDDCERDAERAAKRRQAEDAANPPESDEARDHA